MPAGVRMPKTCRAVHRSARSTQRNPPFVIAGKFVWKIAQEAEEHKRKMEEAIAELARERRDSAALEARYADLEATLATERREKAEHRRAALSSAASLEAEREAALALQKQVADLKAELAAEQAKAAVRPSPLASWSLARDWFALPIIWPGLVIICLPWTSDGQ